LGAGDGGWEGFAFEGPDTDVGFGHAGGDEEVVLGEVEASDTAEHLSVHGLSITERDIYLSKVL